MAGALHVLTGATASGKEAVALLLAERIGGEIISVDSMKVYREMDIGTAKPSSEQRRRVPHHMIDVVDPGEPYDVAQYLSGAALAESAILARAATPVFSGGTPLYLRGLLYGLFRGPSADPSLRQQLAARARVEGTAVLHEELRRLDPVAAVRIHPNDEKRLVRALEVVTITGRPISSLQTQYPRPRPGREARVAALAREPDDLRRRIRKRLDRMFQVGFVEEVRSLRERLGATARESVGYREVMEHLDGARSFEETYQRIERRTWRLARKQMTWFRSFGNLEWVPVAPDDRAEAVAERVLSLWRASAN